MYKLKHQFFPKQNVAVSFVDAKFSEILYSLDPAVRGTGAPKILEPCLRYWIQFGSINFSNLHIFSKASENFAYTDLFDLRLRHKICLQIENPTNFPRNFEVAGWAKTGF